MSAICACCAEDAASPACEGAGGLDELPGQQVVHSQPVFSGGAERAISAAEILRRAIAGVAVELLPPRPSMGRVAARCRVSPDLSQFRIAGPGVELRIGIADLLEVYVVETDGISAFPKAIIDCLDEGELPRLARLRFRIPGGEVLSMCILEEATQPHAGCMVALRLLLQCAGNSTQV
mmetsp:Transcript_76713/g.222735  ORF Transcript_76713/g.222735 Transcript_76713/m.222735 type:complete len:178 (+) Transcript_76713:181-714(+)